MLRQGRRRAGALALVASLAAALAGADGAGAAGSLPPVDVSAATTGGRDAASCPRSPGSPASTWRPTRAATRSRRWTRNNGGGNQMVQTAFRPAGGSFGAPQDVGLTRPCYFLGFGGATPDVELDSRGNAVIVFPATAANGKIVTRAALKPADGAFGSPIDLSNNAEAAEAIQCCRERGR